MTSPDSTTLHRLQGRHALAEPRRPATKEVDCQPAGIGAPRMTACSPPRQQCSPGRQEPFDGPRTVLGDRFFTPRRAAEAQLATYWLSRLVNTRSSVAHYGVAAARSPAADNRSSWKTLFGFEAQPLFIRHRTNPSEPGIVVLLAKIRNFSPSARPDPVLAPYGRPIAPACSVQPYPAEPMNRAEQAKQTRFQEMCNAR